ncbi:DUF4145 domain-containing protein [Acinetobacter sp. IK31]|uniref:DUF4145 domain-containing protein n=1 Tax=Acinetobacter sp. IK31 TaxID=2928895 RepID=UPI002D2000D9|nr:DUF4145 domain-containing protein [Acinetobacter sp. IK31]MEB3863094.1 DUF4145 domain-containing protein [Acinetobacter sp. IK31]
MFEKYISFLSGFTKDSEVPFPCPACGRTTLEISSDSIIKQETVASIKNQEEDFDIETIEEVYKGIFICMNKKCNEQIYHVGKSSYDWEYFDYIEIDGYASPSRREPFSYMVPEYITPFIKYFDIPNKAPNEIVNALNEAFKLTPTSYSAAANKVRIAVEILCSIFGIEARRENGSFIVLNKRLESIKEENGLYPFKTKLTAIKWLGNAGSHEEDDVDIYSLFDSFEIIKSILDGLYNKSDRVDQLAEFVIENKGILTPLQRRIIKKAP